MLETLLTVVVAFYALPAIGIAIGIIMGFWEALTEAPPADRP